MMSQSPSTGPNPKDDGFRIAEAAVDRAVADVMSTPLGGRIGELRPVLSMAASIALVLGLGLALSGVLRPKPCVTFACQLEALSDEELSGMMELMEEESLLELDEEDWATLY